MPLVLSTGSWVLLMRDILSGYTLVRLGVSYLGLEPPRVTWWVIASVANLAIEAVVERGLSLEIVNFLWSFEFFRI